VKVVLIF